MVLIPLGPLAGSPPSAGTIPPFPLHLPGGHTLPATAFLWQSVSPSNPPAPGQKLSALPTPQNPRGPAYLKPREPHLGTGGRHTHLLMFPGNSTGGWGWGPLCPPLAALPGPQMSPFPCRPAQHTKGALAGAEEAHGSSSVRCLRPRVEPYAPEGLRTSHSAANPPGRRFLPLLRPRFQTASLRR